jgi:hypothetical protein
LSDLLQEPQTNAPATPQVEQSSQTSRATAATNAAATAKAQSVGAETLLPRPAISDADLSRLMDNLRATSAGQTKLTQALNTLLNARNLPQQADAVVRSPSLTQQSAQTINLQLNALEQHRVAWQGELWPGQHFEWEISDESNHGGHAGNADGGRNWAKYRQRSLSPGATCKCASVPPRRMRRQRSKRTATCWRAHWMQPDHR